jgi:lantibiotic modifying enzyme
LKSDRSKIKENLLDIISACEDLDEKDTGSGFLTGRAGVLLFLSTAYKEGVFSDSKNKLESLVNSIVGEELSREAEKSITLCDGQVGIFYVLLFLYDSNLLDNSKISYLDLYDSLIIEKVFSEIEENKLDLLHGALGMISYLIYRFNLGFILVDKMNHFLNGIIGAIDRKKISFQEIGFVWKSKFDSVNDASKFNLGAAHGLASLLLFFSKLSKLEKVSLNFSLLQTLITGCLSTFKIIFIQNVRIQQQSIFPSFCSFKEVDRSNSTRLAWCYGDLSIGYSIIMGAKSIGDKIFFNLGKRICLNTTKRIHKNAGVLDAGFCHGASGLAVLYDLIRKETNDPLFEDSIKYWAIRSLKFAQFEDGLAGYKTYNNDHIEWENNYSLLEGISGIGYSYLYFRNRLNNDLLKSLFLI